MACAAARRVRPRLWAAAAVVGCLCLLAGPVAAEQPDPSIKPERAFDGEEQHLYCDAYEVECCGGECCEAEACDRRCEQGVFVGLVGEYAGNTTTPRELCNLVENLRFARSAYLCGGGVAILACIATLVLYANAHPVQKLSPADLLRNRAYMDLFVSIGFIIPGLFGTYESPVCELQAVVIQFSTVFSLGWWVSFSYETLWSVRDPFTNHFAHLRYYHGWGWFFSILTTAILVASGDIGLTEYEFCWISFNADITTAFVVMYLPVLVAVLTSVGVVLWMRVFSSVAIPESHKIRKIAISQSLWTICLLGLYWLFTGVVFFGLFGENTMYSSKTVVLMCCCQAFRGPVGLIVWLKTAQLARQGYAMNTTSICSDLGPNATEMNTSFLDTKAADGENVRRFLTRLPVAECKESIPLKWALRKDVVHACQQGIVTCAKRAWQAFTALPDDYTLQQDDFEEEVTIQCDRPDSDAASFTFQDKAPLCFYAIRQLMGISTSTYRTIVGYEQSDDALMEKFSDGGSSGSFFYFTALKEFIVKTVTEEESKQLVKLLPSMYGHFEKYPHSLICRIYGLHGIKMHRGAKTTHFVVMDNIFLTKRSIDQVYDIKGSWVDRGPVKDDDDEDGSDVETPNARGGSFFVAAINRTLKKRKKRGQVLKDLDLVDKKGICVDADIRRMLLAQIEADSNYFAEHNIMDYSLLIGVHQGPFRELRKPRRDLCVDFTAPPDAMESPVRHKRWNRKVPSKYRPPGSTSASPSPASSMPNSPVASPLAAGGGSPAAGMMESHPSDDSFDVTPEPPMPHTTPIYRQHEGGLFCGVRHADDHIGDNMYFLGIIDILQAWNMNKQWEHMCKIIVLGKDPDGISAVRPQLYARRFRERCQQIFTEPRAPNGSSASRPARNSSVPGTSTTHNNTMSDRSAAVDYSTFTGQRTTGTGRLVDTEILLDSVSTPDALAE